MNKKNKLIDTLKYIYLDDKKILPILILSIVNSCFGAIIPIYGVKYIVNEIIVGGSSTKKLEVIFITMIFYFINLIIECYIDAQFSSRGELVNILINNKINLIYANLPYYISSDSKIYLLKQEVLYNLNNQGTIPRIYRSLREISKSIYLILSLIYFGITDKKILVILILSTIIIINLNKYLKNIMSERSSKVIPLNDKVDYFQSLSNRISTMQCIKIYNLGMILKKKYNKLLSGVCNILEYYATKISKYNSYIEIIRMITFSLCIYILMLKYNHKDIDLTVLVVQFGYFKNYLTGITKILYEYVNFRTVEKFYEKYVRWNKYINNLNLDIEMQNKIDSNLKTVEFKNVSFKYPNSDDFAICNLNLKIPMHKKTCIVGMNGSGKTTFIQLLIGLLMPSSGNIVINGNTKNEKLDIIDKCSCVFQNYNLYSISILENLICNTKPDKKTVEALLREFGLFELINEKEQGLDSILYNEYTNGGINFSKGQLQKLAIIRALLKKTDIILFDESTSALDVNVESEIFDLIEKNINNETLIYVTHRMANCYKFDNIIVFDKGRIVEMGTHDELIEMNGLYRKLYELQMSKL